MQVIIRIAQVSDMGLSPGSVRHGIISLGPSMTKPALSPGHNYEGRGFGISVSVHYSPRYTKP